MLLKAEHFLQNQNEFILNLLLYILYDLTAQKDKNTKKTDTDNTKTQKGMKDEKTER